MLSKNYTTRMVIETAHYDTMLIVFRKFKPMSALP